MNNQQQFIPALRFKPLTRLYDFIMGVTFPVKKIKCALLEQGDLENGYEVLDFGCGTATFLIMGKQQYPEINFSGLDVDDEILKIAGTKVKKQNINVELVRYDGGHFPIADKLFDRIFSTLVFHHLSTKNKKISLSEIFRVLKDDGELHIADFGKAKNGATRLLFHFFRFFDGLENTSLNAKGKLMEMIREAGFSNVQSLNNFNTAFGMVELIKAKKI